MKTTDTLDEYISVKIPGTHFQVLSLCLLCLLVLINTSIGTMTDNVLPVVQKDYELSDAKASIISGFSNVGSIMGILIANYCWQKVGPMRTLMFSLFVPFIFFYTVFFTQGFYSCFFAWVVQSLALSIGDIPLSVYFAETAPLNSRGRWTVALGISATCGRILSTVLSNFLINESSSSSWKNPLYAHAILYTIVTAPIFIYFQESLRYLYANKKHEEFVTAVNRIIKINQRSIDNKITPDLATLEEVRVLGDTNSKSLEENPSAKSQLKQLFGKKYTSLTVVLSLVWIFLVAHFAGFGIILSFWFDKYGSMDKYLFMGMTYSSEILAMSSIFFMIDNECLGRKKSMQIFGILSCLLYASNYFVKNQTAVNVLFFLERYSMKSTVILLNTYTSEIFPDPPAQHRHESQ